MSLWARVVFAFLCFLEPAHVLPVCMINLFSLIIYVIQNVIYVSVNFELWPIRRIVNLSSQTLSEYTLLHSLVWSTHKSLQTGAEVHSLSFQHSPSQKLETWDWTKQQWRGQLTFVSTRVKATERNCRIVGRAHFDLRWIIKNVCNRCFKKHLDLLNSSK